MLKKLSSGGYCFERNLLFKGGGSIILDSFSGLSEASLSGFYWVLMIVLILCKKNKG